MSVEEHMQQFNSIVELPDTLDLRAAGQLCEHIMKCRRSHLRIDASEVRALGAQCLQVLLAARTTWAQDQFDITYEGCTQRFIDDLKLLGLEPSDLTFQVAPK